MAHDLKPVTVRLPHEDLLLAEQEAQVLGVGVGVYLRMLVRQGLRQTDSKDSKQHRAEALLRFSRAMSSEASTKGYTPDDMLAVSKQARRKVAAKRRKAMGN